LEERQPHAARLLPKPCPAIRTLVPDGLFDNGTEVLPQFGTHESRGEGEAGDSRFSSAVQFALKNESQISRQNRIQFSPKTFVL
jgi:hypothetical protein